MVFTQGVLASLVADRAPPDLRGTAFGIFSLVKGLALLIARVVAGLLRDAVGPRATLLGGATYAALSLAGLLAVRWTAPPAFTPHASVAG